MLDTNARVATPALPISDFEFLRAQLSPTGDGRIFVAVTATVVDDNEPQLLDRELVSDCVATIDAALALIAEHACQNFHQSNKENCHGK
jgi:hypothetical protein